MQSAGASHQWVIPNQCKKVLGDQQPIDALNMIIVWLILQSTMLLGMIPFI